MSWRHSEDITLSDYDDPGSKFPAAVIRSDDPETTVNMVAFVTHDRLYPEETNRNVRLVENAPKLLKACDKLVAAAEQRDSTMGDPLRLIECKGTLATSAREARDLIAIVKGQAPRQAVPRDEMFDDMLEALKMAEGVIENIRDRETNGYGLPAIHKFIKEVLDKAAGGL